jgi:hypothetical protein
LVITGAFDKQDTTLRGRDVLPSWDRKGFYS